MGEWWEALSDVHRLFYLVAIPATLVLVLQTLLLLIGLGHDESDADQGFDSDHECDPAHDHGNDAGAIAGLRILTIRGIVAFFSVAGWMGVASLDLGMSPWLAVLIAFASGLAAMYAVALIIKFAVNMQQNGNIDFKNAIGLIGDVYVPLSPDGHGKVNIVIQERFMEMDAVTKAETIKTGQRVRVIDVTDTNTLIVEKA